MNTLVLLAVCLVILLCGYIFYGRWLVKQWGVGKGDIPTPAHTMEDGVDYVPAKAPVLMGHHFRPLPAPPYYRPYRRCHVRLAAGNPVGAGGRYLLRRRP